MKTALTLAFAALVLTACSGRHEEEVVANNADEANMASAENNAATAAPVNVANAANVAKPAAEAPTFTQDAQMHDDADATGMTSRIDRNAAETGAASNAAK